jgi:murein DD-endopeptidase MepM/ murein hydrolase activator NlpD
LPDLPPPEADRANAAGNHIVLSCDGMQVELAHFQQGSINVARGAHVSVGQQLGQVGNSGNSTEPHLHIHAVNPKTGIGIPVTFDGRYPTRNSIFRK